MQRFLQIYKNTIGSSSKRLLIILTLLLLFIKPLFAVNESGSPNINSSDYEYRATDITWTSGTINLAGGTLEIEGDFTVSSGAALNFNSGTLIIHGTFTYPSNLQVNGILAVDNNLIVSGSFHTNGSGLAVVNGDFHSYGGTSSDGILVVNGTIDTHNQSVNFNSTNVYAFDGYQNCSSSECTEIKNYSQWNANPSHPGINYLTSGALIFSSSGNFTVPAGVTTIRVEAWGGGAGGANNVGYGGGGGAYASEIISVNPGDIIPFQIGSGGSSGSDGDSTIFGNNIIIAAGAQGQTGGSAGDCVGSVAFSGGNGGYGGGNSGGGGGGSAWTDTNGGTGGNGGGSTGGPGGTGTGNGGIGGAGTGTPGQNGNIPGGGGGGGGNKANGGNGANGQISISWSDLPYIYFTSASTSIIESNTTLSIEVEISSTSTSTVSANFSVTTNIATAGTDYSILTSSPISISPGSTTTTISVQIIDDSILDQFGESVTLTLNNPTNASLGTPVSHTINIIENEFSDPSLVVAPTEICITNQVVFTADPLQGNCGQITAFYYSMDGSVWQQIPNNQLAYNGCKITYTPPTAGNFFYYYEHSNFGNSNVVGVNVLSVPAKPTNFSGLSSVIAPQSGVVYSVDPIVGAAAYEWTYSGTGATISGSGNSITIDFSAGATSGNLTVRALSNACEDGALSDSYLITVTPSCNLSAEIKSDFDDACPELIKSQGFEPESASYDPGATKVTFTITRAGSIANWSFNYQITDATVRSISPYPSPNPQQSPEPIEVSGNSTVLEFYINNNNLSNPTTVTLNLTDIQDDDECEGADVSESISIKAMPALGPFD